jgi:hypothetical protein
LGYLKFKNLIPEIVNTAPTEMRVTFTVLNSGGGFVEVPNFHFTTLSNDPDYILAEGIREEIVNNKAEELKSNTGSDPTSLAHPLSKRPIDEIVEFVKELAAVAKFDTTQPEGL